MTLAEHESGYTTRLVNESGLSDEVVRPAVDKIERQLAAWVENTQQRSQSPSMFYRSGYKGPDNYYSQLELARHAVRSDDVVGGAADVTEGLIFQGAKWEGEHEDDADVYNQIARDLNMDDFLRAAYRELFTASQIVVATWWGRKSYTVRGYNAPKPVGLEKSTDPATGMEVLAPPRDPETNLPVKPPRRGTKRRKAYDVFVPTRMTLLDSARVIPIGNRLWGEDRLAWQASTEEMEIWQGMAGGDLSYFDTTMASLMLGQYVPGKEERIELSEWGIDPDRLLELNPERVFRHTLTRPSYSRWPDLRMRSIFRLLDLKQQLQNSDRVALVGSANYILLVRKGTDAMPAHQAEVDNLKENMAVLAKVPIMISDHRLEIQIITPAQDYTLDPAKHDLLNRGILSRLLGSLSVASSGQRNETSVTLARMVGRLLESRRQMLKRTIELKIGKAIMDANPKAFEDEPNLAFTPRQVQLDADQQLVQAILALRTQNELSRETVLEFFGFDQDVEAQRRINEEEAGLDEVFKTAVPFDSPANALGAAGGVPPAAQAANGAQGGRPIGGGQPPASSGARTASPTARARADKKRVRAAADEGDA